MAFYVSSAGGGVMESELREHLSAVLPSYMIPAKFIPLDALPLSHSVPTFGYRLAEPDVDEVLLSVTRSGAPSLDPIEDISVAIADRGSRQVRRRRYEVLCGRRITDSSVAETSGTCVSSNPHEPLTTS